MMRAFATSLLVTITVLAAGLSWNPPAAMGLATKAPARPAQPAQSQPGAGVSFPTQAQPGNIFTVGQKVEIEAAVEFGDSVDWTVTDFLGKKVDSGAGAVGARKARIEPKAVSKGYYLMQITAKTGDKVEGQGQTSYAVIAPFDASRMTDARFGAAGQYDKTMPVESLPILAKAGIMHIRDDVEWNGVEREKGVFDFSKSDRYAPEAQKCGMTWCPVMAFGNKFYDSQAGVQAFNDAPCTPEGYAAYANYIGAVLKHYGQQVKELEIWNEYNGSFCAGKAASDRPKYYTEMLKVAYEKIKAERPDVHVVGGAMVLLPLPYFEKLCKAGALKYMDGIAVHPYMDTPEGVERNVAALVEMTRKYNNGKSKPISVTECGTWQDSSVERTWAAGYLVRMYALLLTCPEVEHIDWFLVCDYAEFKNQGIIHGDKNPMGKFTPVALYPAYANLVQQLHHARFVRREQTDPRTRVYQFQRDGQAIWVCWSTFADAQLIFAAKDAVRLVDMVGGDKDLTPVSGQVSVTVGDSPVYVVAGTGAVTEVAEAPRKDQVIADLFTDFGSEQGKAGWTYGYFVSNKDGSAPYEPDKVQPMRWESSPGDWDYCWFGPAQWFCISGGAAQPSAVQGGQGWTVLRWTSDRDGTVHVMGKANRKNKNGDGVAVKVFLDGKEIFSRFLPPEAQADIDLSPAVKKGSRLDFVVTPGPGTDTGYDATSLQATILTPPK